MEADALVGTAGIIHIPCISRKEETEKIAATAPTAENSPAPRKSLRASSWPYKNTPATN